MKERNKWILPGVTPSQNELDGKHWRVKHSFREEWHTIVGYVLGRKNPPETHKCSVSFVRVSKRLIDPLNVYSGLKWALDACVELGWLRGDAYKDIEISVMQRKCEAGEEPHMELEIECLQ